MRSGLLVGTAILLGILLGNSGCWIQEDPALLQPLQADTAFVRVLNLAADRQVRSVSIGNLFTIADVGYAQLSPLRAIPADSLIVRIHRSGADTTWQDSIVLRKGTYTTFVVLQIQRGGDIRDTVVPLVALPAPSEVTVSKVGIRLLNAIPDSALYGIAVGCPSSHPTFGFVPYARISNFVERPPGDLVLSVLRRYQQQDSVLQFVRITTAAPFSFTLILFRDVQGQWQLGVLNEQQSAAAWQLAEPTTELTATLTIANLTTAPIAVQLNETPIFPAVSPWQRSLPVSIEACRSVEQDTLTVTAGSGVWKIPAQFEVQKEYVLVATADTGGIRLLLHSYPLSSPAGQAVIQLYNATSEASLLAASGTRQLADGRLAGGEVLANNWHAGTVSSPISVFPGTLPLAFFHPDSANRFVQGVIATLQQRSYLGVVLHRNAQFQMVLLPQGQEQTELTPLPTGRFLRVVNLKNQPIVLSAAPVFTQLTMPAESELSTVLPLDAETVEIDQHPVTFQGTPEQRAAVLIAPVNDSSFVTALFYQLPRSVDYPAIRLFHLADGIAEVNVSLDSLHGDLLLTALPFGEHSDFIQLPRERRTTLVFWHPETKERYTRLENLFALRGRAYTIVFYRSPRGYRTFLLQEF